MARNASISVGTSGWASRINAAWRQLAASIIETGRLLIEAKKAVPHGDFTRMIDGELNFKPRVAQRLMEIARDERLANASIASLLPPSWTVLHELTKLEDEEFEAALKAGTINPEMQRKDVSRKPRTRHELPAPAINTEELEPETEEPPAVAEDPLVREVDTDVAEAEPEPPESEIPTPAVTEAEIAAAQPLVLSPGPTDHPFASSRAAAAEIAAEPVHFQPMPDGRPDPRDGKIAVWIKPGDHQQIANALLPIVAEAISGCAGFDAGCIGSMSYDAVIALLDRFPDWLLEYADGARDRESREAAA